MTNIDHLRHELLLNKPYQQVGDIKKHSYKMKLNFMKDMEMVSKHLTHFVTITSNTRVRVIAIKLVSAEPKIY